MKIRKKVLEMNEKELKAIAGVVVPTIPLESMSKGDIQEEIINWLLLNGLSVAHLFTIVEDDDGDFAVLPGASKCDCCQGSINPGSPRFLSAAFHSPQRLPPFRLIASTGNLCQETSFANKSDRAISENLAVKNGKSQMAPSVIDVQPIPLKSNFSVVDLKDNHDDEAKKSAPATQGSCYDQCLAECGVFCVKLIGNL